MVNNISASDTAQNHLQPKIYNYFRQFIGSSHFAILVRFCIMITVMYTALNFHTTISLAVTANHYYHLF